MTVRIAQCHHGIDEQNDSMYQRPEWLAKCGARLTCTSVVPLGNHEQHAPMVLQLFGFGLKLCIIGWSGSLGTQRGRVCKGRLV
eukprot:5426409-Amphidinium_carterae.2